jgi:hypothetical protein
MIRLKWSLGGLVLALGLVCCELAGAQPGTVLAIRTTDGRDIFATTTDAGITIAGKEGPREIPFGELLSLHTAHAPSEHEATVIEEHLAQIGREKIFKEDLEYSLDVLTEIGLPLQTPLLERLTDDDGIRSSSSPRYRLYSRIMPRRADGLDRTLDMARLKGGEIMRADLVDRAITVTPLAGDESEPASPITLEAGQIRRLAVMQKSITREVELDSLRHCLFVGFMDTGVFVTPESSLTADAEGFIRIDFQGDGWATDPDGIHVPPPTKRPLNEGFRWGAILGRVGPAGQYWFVGKHVEKEDLTTGRLYFVINESHHWENNIGSFRMKIVVKNGFDVGEAY